MDDSVFKRGVLRVHTNRKSWYVRIGPGPRKRTKLKVRTRVRVRVKVRVRVRVRVRIRVNRHSCCEDNIKSYVREKD